MAIRKKSRPESVRAQSRVLAEALKTASEQPGIKELMAVRDAWAKFDVVMRHYRAYTVKAPMVSLSCNSGAVTRQI